MKKVFFAVLVIVAVLVATRLYEQAKENAPKIEVIEEVITPSEEQIFDVKDENISDEDIVVEEQADDIEEENPELTQDEDETIITE